MATAFRLLLKLLLLLLFNDELLEGGKAVANCSVDEVPVTVLGTVVKIWAAFKSTSVLELFISYVTVSFKDRTIGNSFTAF
jgi:hypothetical protein